MLKKNQALTLISIQHRLTMSVGLSLDMASMTKQFSRAVIKKLNVQSVDFIFFSPHTNTITLDTHNRLEYNLPICDTSVLTTNPTLFSQLTTWLETSLTHASWTVLTIKAAHYHVFFMEGVGILMLKRKHKPLSRAIISSLQDIIMRLTVACQACFQHTTLLEEIKQRSKIQTELEEEKCRIQTTLHSIGDAVITIDTHGIITYMNPIATTMTGRQPDKALHKNIFDIMKLSLEKPYEDKKTLHSIAELQALLRHNNTAFNLHNHNQAKRVLKLNLAPILPHKPEQLGYVVTLHDITHTYNIEQELRFQAWHDPLTQLANRRNLESNLKKAIYTAKHKDSIHILLYIDLDRFKVVNDSCGHAAGDQLLKAIVYVMKSQIRHRDLLVRVGGDEFALLLHDTDISEALVVAERIRSSISAYRFEQKNKIFSIGASIGAVEITAYSTDTEDLLAHADIACYTAKEAGRNRVHVYRESDNEIIQHRQKIEWAGRIASAIEQDSFELYCQMVSDLNNLKKPLHHFEILLRMRENGKIIRPGTFLPAAERHGMIHEVDSWVIMNVLDLLEKYAIPEHVNAQYTMININLSGVSMGDAEILNYLVRRLKPAPKLAKLLCFEITETAAISSIENCQTFMNTLTNLGCRFALDDFGNGFSSFSYLKNLPVHYLKIDGSFIQNMVHDTVDRTLVNSIYRTAEELNIETIAEFIENKETYQLLKKMGLKLGQGYFFDKPHPFKPALLRAFPTRFSCVG